LAPTSTRGSARRRSAPLLVVEVDVEECFEHDRWRHPTGYRQVRLDPLAEEITGSSAP
jgi:hypothetical protein